jgi:glycerol kinase
MGYWRDTDEIKANWRVGIRWQPDMADDARQALLKSWDKAVRRAFDWKEDGVEG